MYCYRKKAENKDSVWWCSDFYCGIVGSFLLPLPCSSVYFYLASLIKTPNVLLKGKYEQHSDDSGCSSVGFKLPKPSMPPQLSPRHVRANNIALTEPTGWGNMLVKPHV